MRPIIVIIYFYIIVLNNIQFEINLIKNMNWNMTGGVDEVLEQSKVEQTKSNLILTDKMGVTN